MHLIVLAIERETPDLIRNNVRLEVIGDRSRVPADVNERLDACRRATASCTGLTLIAAISYSSRWEITEAARALAREAAAGTSTPAPSPRRYSPAPHHRRDARSRPGDTHRR